MLQLIKQAQEFKISSLEPLDKREEGEVVIGELCDELKGLLGLCRSAAAASADFRENNCTEMKELLESDDCTPADFMEFKKKFQKDIKPIESKVHIYWNAFWAAVEVEFDIAGKSIAIREDFKVVTLPENEEDNEPHIAGIHVVRI